MSEECTHNCKTCSQNCGERKEPQDLRVPQNEQSDIKKVIGVVSGKGGVGKSFVTCALACAVQRSGKSAAVLDADITGPSVPRLFGLTEKADSGELGIFPEEAENGVKVMSVNLLLQNDTDPVVWRGPIIAGTVKQFWTDVLWGDVDYMFVDMPPGTGDVPLTVFQSLPVDGIVVVSTPQQLVGMVVEKAAKMANLMHIPLLGFVENMSYFECPDCKARHSIFGESRIDELAKRYGVDCVVKIPIDPAVAALCDSGHIEDVDTFAFGELTEKLLNL